jgi:hypothetical protein
MGASAAVAGRGLDRTRILPEPEIPNAGQLPAGGRDLARP